MDPSTRTRMVLLTNRVYLRRRSGFEMQECRREVFGAVTGKGD